RPVHLCRTSSMGTPCVTLGDTRRNTLALRECEHSAPRSITTATRASAYARARRPREARTYANCSHRGPEPRPRRSPATLLPMQMPHRRKTALAALALVLAPVMSSCGFDNATDRDY